MHTVRGVKRHGFTMDPGASSGLGGTDTKREYDEAKVPLSQSCSVSPNPGANFSGISGEP